MEIVVGSRCSVVGSRLVAVAAIILAAIGFLDPSTTLRMTGADGSQTRPDYRPSTTDYYFFAKPTSTASRSPSFRRIGR